MDDDSKILKGPVNNTKTKNHLVRIAKILGMPDFDETVYKPVVLRQVKEYIEANQEKICNDPKLQGLVMYRADSMGSGREGRGNTKSKTSADKAAEDATESSKASLPPTGCVAFKIILNNLFNASPERTRSS